MSSNRSQELEAPVAQPRNVKRRLPIAAWRCLGAFAISLAVFAVYDRSAEGPFIIDDIAAIVENQSIRQIWPLTGGGEQGAPLNPPVDTPFSGRPLVNLSFAANYAFGELDPYGYRLVQMALHVLTALLLWAIVSRTLRLDYFQGRFESVAGWLSFLSALIWAMHPLVTETVVYVTQRTELMMGLLYLATLYCAIRYWATTRSQARAAWLALATLACVAGMLCKEMIASAPAMALLYERTFLTGTFRRSLARSWRLYAGLSLGWLVAVALHFNGMQTPMTGFDLGVTALEWWLTQTKVFFLYLKLAIWPWPLVIHYEIPFFKSVSEAWPWVLSAVVYGIVALVLVWRRRPTGYVMTWVVAVLSPTLVIPLVGETVAERRMYVPLAALVPLLVVGGYRAVDWVWKALTKRSVRTTSAKNSLVVASILGIALAVGLGLLSSRRLEAYRDRLSLWEDAFAYQPHDPVVRAGYGVNLSLAGRHAEALVQFKAWARLKPESHWAHYNLARSFEAAGQPTEAIAQYQRVIELQPDHGASYYNLARLWEARGEWAAAITNYQRALKAQPDFPAAHTNLGVLLLDAGKSQQAIKHLRAALESQQTLDNYKNLILALGEANQTDEAIALTTEALALAKVQDNAVVVAQLESVLATLRRQTPKRPAK